MRSTRSIQLLGITFLILGIASCGVKNEAQQEATLPPTSTTTPVIPSPTATSTPQAISTPEMFGPDKDEFPQNYNPLSGLPVEDPNLLTYPAMLVSISHFPAVARPQAGLSFAPWVFEYYITEGATRFLAVFHGEFPAPEIPVRGDCEIRKGMIAQTANIIGNRVWLDENKNGRQEPYENGVGGVCINIYDEANQLVDTTTTDSNGYYGFNVNDGKYEIEFVLPEWLEFTAQNVGDENADSDADQSSGRTDADVQSTLLFLDAGLILSENLISVEGESAQMPKAEVGPVRSGRLIYADIAAFFKDSCLIYAFASEEVLEQIPHCAMVAHEDAGGGSMLPLDRMLAIAEDVRPRVSNFNYTGNLFTETIPEGGAPAREINVYVALLNQSGWKHDPLSGAWLRFVDDSTNENAGVLHPEIDRLTGRQLLFENVIVIFAAHDVVTPTNLDIHLEMGDEGYAYLFRDGMKYDIRWITKAGEYEKQTGQRRPMRFINADGSPAALKPGSTWIFVATPYSALTDQGAGIWKLRFYAPEGSR